jgi:hypothetical protein
MSHRSPAPAIREAHNSREALRIAACEMGRLVVGKRDKVQVTRFKGARRGGPLDADV